MIKRIFLIVMCLLIFTITMIYEIQEAKAFALTLTTISALTFVVGSMLIASGAMIPNDTGFYAGLVETVLSLQYETRLAIENAINQGKEVINLGEAIFVDVYRSFSNVINSGVTVMHTFVDGLKATHSQSFVSTAGDHMFLSWIPLDVYTLNHRAGDMFPNVGLSYIFVCLEAMYIFTRLDFTIEYRMYWLNNLQVIAESYIFNINDAITTRTLIHQGTEAQVSGIWFEDHARTILVPNGLGYIVHGEAFPIISQYTAVNPILQNRILMPESVSLGVPTTWNPNINIVNPLAIPLPVDSLIGLNAITYPEWVITQTGTPTAPDLPIAPEGFFEGVLHWLAELWSAIMSIPLGIINAINGIGNIIRDIPLILQNILSTIVSIPLSIIDAISNISDMIRDIPYHLTNVLSGLESIVGLLTTGLIGDVRTIRLPDVSVEYTSRFPFSLPFDINYIIVNTFQRRDIQPFRFELYNPVGDNIILEVDLFDEFPQLNQLLQFIRIGLSLIFMISMIYATPKLLGGS